MPDIQLPALRSSQRLRKPLVEYCTNEWRSASTLDHSPGPQFEGDTFLDRVEIFVDRSIAVIRAPKFRRLFLVLVGMTISVVVLWTKVAVPFVRQERATWSSLTKRPDSAADGIFGVNVRPRFADMTHLQTLDPSLVPGSLNEKGELSNKKRLVFVGDIHGCREELEDLLKKVKFDPATDHLIAAGDVVNKGPDSPGVIDLLRGYKASCVRGNHDDRLLLMAEDLQSTSLESKNKVQQGREHTKQVDLNANDAERELAKSLNSEQVAWLKSCPVILRVGQLKAFPGETMVVHAGLVPGLGLDHQDPTSVMNMRVIDLSTHVPSKQHEREGSVPWYKLWNRYQQLLPARQRFDQLKNRGKPRASEGQITVIYGHDARKGLRLQKYSKGLDTGCVRGGKLTALVVDDTGKQKLVQVDCHDYHDRRSQVPVPVDVEDAIRKRKPGPPAAGDAD